MPFYMTQWTYKSDQMKALVANPSDRAEAARRAAEAFGGRLHHFFFAFGDYDGVAISEFPDAESGTAFAMTIVSGGAVSHLKTTVLIGPDEALRAMRRAGEIQSGYRPPSG